MKPILELFGRIPLDNCCSKRFPLRGEQETESCVCIVAQLYHSTGGEQVCVGRGGRAAEYAAARKVYSRSIIIAGPDGLVLTTRQRGLSVEPASIRNAGEETI